MFSVENEDEAERLIVLACERNMRGEYIAKELAQEQNLLNLRTFSDRLEDIYNKYIRKDC